MKLEPQPDTARLALSEQLKNSIQAHIIQSGGRISFAEYMRHALYTPDIGYYNNKFIAFGENGDFITAPEISALFSKTIAQYIKAIPQSQILEFGAGSGIMAADIMLSSNQIQKYLIIEPSAYLQAIQKTTIQQQAPHLFGRFAWLTSLPAQFTGIVLANEVVDALPCQRFIIDQNQTYELMVDKDFNWVKGAEITIDLPYPLAQYPNGFISEYNPLAAAWLKSIATMLKQGLVLLIDYGYEDFDYYQPARDSGTLMCFYRHQQHTDPFMYPGLQDISCHVNFTQLINTARQYKLKLSSFLSQAEFLLDGGILEIAADDNLDKLSHRIKMSQQIQKLTMPGQMGEVIKVLALSKNL